VRHSFDFSCANTFSGPLHVMGRRIVQMEVSTSRWFSVRMWTYSVDQTWNNNLIQECWIICCPFGNVHKAVNAGDRPENWNQALLTVIFFDLIFLALRRANVPRSNSEDSIRRTKTHPRW
jgi:hypothetical protein